MDLELILTVCFFTGIGLTLLSLLFGQLFDLTGVDGLDLGDFGVDLGLPVSPMVYVLGCTVFGGMGLILLQVTPWMPSAVIVIVALLVAILVSWAFYKGVIVPLRKAQNTSAPDQEELVGQIGKVIETIPENGYGEITYVVHGNSFTAPAKSTKGQTIPKGTEISICWIEQYVFYVTAIEAEGNE